MVSFSYLPIRTPVLTSCRVEDILTGKSEADKILYRSTLDFGFVILPDMKWDLITLQSLYLVAISSSSAIRSLRDLRKVHLPMLRSIRTEATRVVQEKWGLSAGAIRLFVHYQPSYCQSRRVFAMLSSLTSLQTTSTCTSLTRTSTERWAAPLVRLICSTMLSLWCVLFCALCLFFQ